MCWQEDYDPTIEDSYMKDNYMVDDIPVPLEIFDTAGQVGVLSNLLHIYDKLIEYSPCAYD